MITSQNTVPIKIENKEGRMTISNEDLSRMILGGRLVISIYQENELLLSLYVSTGDIKAAIENADNTNTQYGYTRTIGG